MDLLNQLLFSLSVTGPICLILVMGVILRRLKIIDDHFINVASNLVFKVTLPTMLFLSLVEAEHDITTNLSLAGFSFGSNIGFFILSAIIIHYLLPKNRDNGVILQGAFRSNTGIIALAYVANLYGQDGLAIGAIYVAITTFLYNILAIVALTPKGAQSGLGVVTSMSKSITKNPLILGIIAGSVYSAIGLPVPKVASDAGHYFASMTLPLALLCTGGSLDLKSLRHDMKPTWIATSLKLILAPVISCSAAILLGFEGIALAIIFFMSCSPTAAASYIMARSMGGNSSLAANIVALTTILSVVTTTIGLVILRSFEWL